MPLTTVGTSLALRVHEGDPSIFRHAGRIVNRDIGSGRPRRGPTAATAPGTPPARFPSPRRADGLGGRPEAVAFQPAGEAGVDCPHHARAAVDQGGVKLYERSAEPDRLVSILGG